MPTVNEHKKTLMIIYQTKKKKTIIKICFLVLKFVVVHFKLVLAKPNTTSPIKSVLCQDSN